MEQITKDWLQKNKKSLIKKNCVVITGAGISVSAGIPDFRSKEGIFEHIKQKYNTKGTELFKYSFGLNPKTRNIYLNFISDFKILSNSLSPSYSHKALNHFLSYQKKYTVYSQNICGLEKKAGIVNLVNLHGDTEKLKCMQCGFLHDFSDECIKAFKQGKEVECFICKNSTRKRVSFRGYLHPNIVHYEEEHPNCAELIDKITKDKDLSLLIVLGTSLKPYGVKQVIKYFLSQLKHKSQKKNKPFISLYINKEAPNKALSSFFTHNWFGTIEDFFMNFFDVLGDKTDFINVIKKEEEKLNEENKENKEVKKNLKIKIRKVNENKLIISNENKFQRKVKEDSLIIDSFVEEISSIINESPEKIENKIKVSKLIEKYENKSGNKNDYKTIIDKIDYKTNISYDEIDNKTIIDNKNDYKTINNKIDYKTIDNKSDNKTNKYRTIILREDGKLEIKLPKKLSLTPTKKNITKANPKNYSPLLKKTKKEDC